jgi:hypothetical protein
MNFARAIIASAAAVLVGNAIVEHNRTVKAERKKREEIKQETLREILAIKRSHLVVQHRILEGKYDLRDFNRGWNEIQNDLKFERIAARIDD